MFVYLLVCVFVYLLVCVFVYLLVCVFVYLLVCVFELFCCCYWMDLYIEIGLFTISHYFRSFPGLIEQMV